MQFNILKNNILIYMGCWFCAVYAIKMYMLALDLNSD
jgi:hypothetical protein